MAGPTRRKVRKGTRSCWECKRKKARCIFSSPGSEVCDACRRRGLRCIGQDLPDPGTESGTTRSGAGSLVRIEAMLEQLLDGSKRGAVGAGIDKEMDTEIVPEGSERDSAQLRSQDSIEEAVTVGEHLSLGLGDVAFNGIVGDRQQDRGMARTQGTASNSRHSNPNPSCQRKTIQRRTNGRRKQPEPTKSLVPPFYSPTIDNPPQYDNIRDALIKAWPAREDLHMNLTFPLEVGESSPESFLAHRAQADKQDEVHSLPGDFLDLPPTGSHPVVYARKLLMLVSCLHSSVLRTDPKAVKLRDNSMKVVKHLVNCHDDMVASLEGIQCLFMESIHHSYTGNLRLAWTTLRRAMTLGQTMGLHRHTRPPSAMKHSHNSPPVGHCSAIGQAEHLWFMLVNFDRYLSLILGLPQCSSGSDFAAPLALESCIPEEQLRRLNCASAGIILQNRESRNTSISRGAGVAIADDIGATREADRMFRDAADRMPPRWWLYPAVPLGDGGRVDEENDSNSGSETGSCSQLSVVREQLRHYHLLAQLHWPSLLVKDDDPRREYSRISVVYASREALARCIALQDARSANFHCPILNGIAFVASLAIVLSYLDYTNKSNFSTDGGVYTALFAHQQARDRGMMEQTLQKMEQMQASQPQNDDTSVQISAMLKKTLALYIDASNGVSFTYRSLNKVATVEGGWHMVEDDGGVRFSTPMCVQDILIENGTTNGDRPLSSTNFDTGLDLMEVFTTTNGNYTLDTGTLDPSLNDPLSYYPSQDYPWDL